MLPMKCPACGGRDYRALITNNLIDSQTMRKRRCQGCGHVWFTVEMEVPEYAVGWSNRHESKPVLRMALELKPEHIEPMDSFESVRRINQRRKERANVAECG